MKPYPKPSAKLKRCKRHKYQDGRCIRCDKKQSQASERVETERELDRVTSLFVRTRDKFCVICGKPVEVAMHWVKRGKKRLRWNVINVNGGCSSCNYRDNTYHEPYTEYMLKRYGKETVLKLIELSKEKDCKFTVPELREMLAYKQKQLATLRGPAKFEMV